ncbi:MAG: PAS domain-containing protein, partial [Bacteroidetes bacterium]|nr:PAS domain-containing protein [Bacteroidota bacterium]
MQAPSLHFTFSHPVAALQEFIPLLLNLGLFIYVFFYFPHNKLTRLFYLFLVPLSIWQLTDLMVHLSADKESAYFWYFLFSPVLNLIAPLAMHFSLVFTRHKDWLKSRALLFSLYFPAIIFVFLSYAGVINFSVHPSPFWGWLIIGNDSIVDLINAWWIVILSIVTLSLLVHHAFKTRNENKNSRKQAKLVAIGISIPTIIGIITEFIFPFLLKTEPIPLLSTTLSAFSVCVLIALRKYELLSFSPRHAWTNIMKNMKEGLLIVNNEDEIEFANDHFCRMTGYTEKELLHKKAANLLLDENERARIDEKIWDRKHQVSEKYEIAIRKKNGDLIWCMISGTPFFDRQGNVIGS